MKQILLASILVLALAGISFAGNIPNDYTGEIPNDISQTSQTAASNTTMVEIITSIINLLPLP